MLLLLAIVASYAGPFLRRPPGVPAVVQRSQLQLDKKVSVFLLDDVSLGAACAEAARQIGVPVRIEADALRAAGVDPHVERVSMRQYNARGHKLLGVITRSFTTAEGGRLAWDVADDGAVVITMAAALRRRVVVAGYDGSWLAGSLEGFHERPEVEEDIRVLVQETVAPDSWRSVTPSGVGWAGFVGDRLWVVHDPDGHRAVAGLMDQLHEQKPGMFVPAEAADRLTRPSGRGWAAGAR